MGFSEVRKLTGFAKKVVNKHTLRKIKAIKEKKEKEEVLKYTIISHLEREYHNVENRIHNLKGKKDLFFVKMKFHTLKNKFNIFKTSLEKKDFKKLMETFHAMKREIEHARTI